MDFQHILMTKHPTEEALESWYIQLVEALQQF